MGNKLKIELAGCVLEVEGEPGFVAQVYGDFKSGLFDTFKSKQHEGADIPSNDEQKKPAKRTRKKSVQKPAAPKSSAKAKVPYSPKLDVSLDTVGLSEFSKRHITKNNAEKLLVYAVFLHEEKGIETISANQLYTCFKTEKEKIPKHFVQAIIDAKNRHGFFEYGSVDDIKVSIVGDNFFNHELNKREGSE